MEKIAILAFIIVLIMLICNNDNLNSKTKAVLTLIQVFLFGLQIYYLIKLL